MPWVVAVLGAQQGRDFCKAKIRLFSDPRSDDSLVFDPKTLGCFGKPRTDPCSGLKFSELKSGASCTKKPKSQK